MAVDWFSFWLKDEEDKDPEKSAMYAHWRELRNSPKATRSDHVEEYFSRCQQSPPGRIRSRERGIVSGCGLP
jgi:hypothetical protein